MYEHQFKIYTKFTSELLAVNYAQASMIFREDETSNNKLQQFRPEVNYVC